MHSQVQCLVSKFYQWVRRMLKTSREIMLIWKKSMPCFLYGTVNNFCWLKVIIIHKLVWIHQVTRVPSCQSMKFLRLSPSILYCSQDSNMYHLDSAINTWYTFHPSLHQAIFICFDSSQCKLHTSVYFTINTLACTPLARVHFFFFWRNEK